MATERAVPQIVEFSVSNYRALKNIRFPRLTPLTVLLGPNGSGKSTVFDVFAFLSECFTIGLRKAWDKRGRFKELRTRGAAGPISFELKYREKPGSRLMTYDLEIDEGTKGPFVARERLRWMLKPKGAGRPFHFLDFTRGTGIVMSGEAPEEGGGRIQEHLDSPEMLAVNTLGQLTRHPRVAALRRFITGWYLSYMTADSTRTTPEAGPQERLSITGDNLPNVIQYLKEQHPERLEKILTTLRQRVPRLDRVDTEILADGRLLLQIKDAPFERPIQAKFASDGTLKMLSYLIVLYDPELPQLIGVEEPENHLHPRLLPELAEECRVASENSQLMVTTHSPFFIDALQPEEVWVLSRDRKGYATAHNVAAMKGIKEFMQEGAHLGQLWVENHFEVGDPLSESRGQGVPFS